MTSWEQTEAGLVRKRSFAQSRPLICATTHRINAKPYDGDKEAGPVLDDMCQLVSEGSMLEETMVKQTWWGG